MAALWTEDNTIGSYMASMLGNRNPGAQYKLGVETRALLDQQAAAEDYIRAQADRLKALQPPSVPLPQGWEGPPSPATPQERSKFDLDRNAAISTMTLGARNPANMLTIARGTASGQAFNDLSLYGVPNDPRELLKQDVQLRGHYPDVALTPKDQYTQAKIDERWANLQSIAQTRDLTNVEQREAQILAGYKNKNKTNVTSTGVVTQDDYNWSVPEQNLIRKAGIAQLAGPPQHQQAPGTAPPGVQQSTVQSAPVSGTGSAVTTGTPTAAPGASRSVSLPTGQQVSITPLPGGTSTAEQAKTTAAAMRADAAYNRIAQTIGVNPQTGQIDPKNYYVPPLLPAIIQEQTGGGLIGGKVSQIAEDLWSKRPEGQRGVNDYYTFARQWVEPVLRYATGAASPPAETVNYFAQFVPNANDSPQLVQDKLDTMRAWTRAISVSSSPAQAQAEMERIAANNPIAMQSVQTARVAAENSGSLNKTYDQIAAEEAALQARGGTTTTGTSTQAPPSVTVRPQPGRYDKLDQLLFPGGR